MLHIYVSINKDSQVLKTASTSYLARKFLNDVSSFHIFQLATQHCVAGNMLTATHGLSEQNVVGTVARLCAGRPRNRGSISGGVKKCFLLWVMTRRNVL